VELAIDDTTLAGQGTLLDPLRAIQTETAQVVLFADLATTEVLKPCTYNNGALGVGATLTGNANGQLSTISFTGKIDNTTTVLGQVILVKNQASQLQNGLYEVTQLGNVSTPFILTRTTDADTQAELYPVQVNVFNGVTNANTAFLQKTVDPVMGTSPIVFQTTPIGITNTPVLHLDTVTSTVLPTCTYTAGTNVTLPGVGAYLQATAVGALGTINGIALVNGMRILVKDQVNQAHNGAYTVANAGNGTTAWKLVRADAWGANFVRLQREWKVNNSLSTKFGARYSTNLNSLANTAVGTTALVFNEVPTVSYKLYSALLTQTGTAAPVVTVVTNTLGTVTIVRDNPGRYSVTTSGLFTTNKTVISINTITTTAGLYGGYAGISDSGSTNVFYIDTTKVIGSGGGIPGTGTDTVLFRTPLEIKVYN
jgi:energy-converting hydrogenase Eha subunit A